MIISASRRTDIPAFFTAWFMNRVKAGFCEVPNPVNAAQVSRVSLAPDDVDVIAFWTRCPAPLTRRLDELDARGFDFFFLFTLMDNPPELDPLLPPLEERLDMFLDLAARIGAQRVIWRYDPIVFTRLTPPAFHAHTFEALCGRLAGATRQCIVSLVDLYARVRRRLAAELPGHAALLEPCPEVSRRLLATMAACAGRHGIRMTSCAEPPDMLPPGVEPGACIDADYLQRTFGRRVTRRKDPGQRKRCRCILSRDIGVYGTCRFGCRYCYAAAAGRDTGRIPAGHDPGAAALTA
jgi:hypothetical protein